MSILEKLHNWTSRKMHDRTLARWGQTRKCPWCRQCVESGGKHSMREAEHCSFFDTFTCGNCGGESHWEFGPFPMFRGLGDGPKPEEWAVRADREVRDILSQITPPEAKP